jgi:biopolymer transport protein ExbD
MAKAKIARKSTSIDMTAMCDVAFLLLTFFMLTSKFKPKEPVAVDIPQSTAQIPIPDRYLLNLTVDKDGKIFIGVDDQKTRLAWLQEISETYGVQFSAKAQQSFIRTDLFGCPVEQLNQIMELESSQLEKYVQPGVPSDSINGRNQLEDLIFLARKAGQTVQPEPFRIVIKSDKDSNFKVVEKLIAILQDRKNKVNKFNLITSAKGGGSEAPKEPTK